MIKILDKIFSMSIWKTLVFNFHYFGLKGLFVLPVLIGKHVEFWTLKGNIICKNFKTAAVQIGMNKVRNLPKASTIATIENNSTIIFEGKNALGVGTRISNSGTLIFGDKTSISANCSIICKNKIQIGKDCNFSWDTQIMDTDLHNIYSTETNELLNPDEPIIIGNHCWITRGAVILKGVTISDNTIIAANSVITKSINKNNVIVTTRGVVLKENVRWEK